jgi:hypothetical protein
METGTTDRAVDYTSGSGSTALIFIYTIQAGDTSSNLDYAATNSLALNGGSIKDAALNAADLVLAAPGTSGSISVDRKVVEPVDTLPVDTLPVVEQKIVEKILPKCGTGIEDVNGICEVIQTEEEGGGCLIATATYGSELAPQVQQLRELRDNQLMNTESGSAFMGTFNDIYYSFSPIIADMEREHPLFKEVVKIAITPMISSLSLMDNANSESEVLGMGLSVIMLNIGMYLGVPAFGIIKVIQLRKN